MDSKNKSAHVDFNPWELLIHTYLLIKLLHIFPFLELGVLAATGSNSIAGEIMLHFLIYLWLIQYFTRPPKTFILATKPSIAGGLTQKPYCFSVSCWDENFCLFLLYFQRFIHYIPKKKVISVKMFSLLQNYLGRVCLCWKKCTYKGSGCWGVGNQCWQQWFVHLI